MVAIDEGVRRKFESDWLSGKSSAIKDYLPPSVDQDTYLGTLEELVCIDLEFRWQKSDAAGATSDRTVSVDQAVVPTRVEDYLREFPELDEPSIIKRLLEQEVLVRVRAGYVVEQGEVKSRFPTIHIDESLYSEAAEQPASGPSRPDTMNHFPRQFGPYVLLELLGRGGMGSVYRARQTVAQREVAIKVAELGSYGPATRELISARFQKEARAAASLSHDHSVPVYDVGEIDDQPYYAMRLVEGGDLGDRSKAEPLEPRLAARYLLGVTRCMEVAHSRGLLHRDIKPQNMMVDRATDRAMLTDFGLARFVEDDAGMTQTGQVLGTPSFMPPEQIRDSRQIDARADIYSLGSSLYQLLTGRPPFKAADLPETLRQVLHQEPVPPRSLNQELDRDLDTICLKCLEKEPQSRYQTAEELAADLESYLHGEPIAARPVGPVRRWIKWSRRNRGLAAATSAAVLGLVAALLASLIGLVVVKRQSRINFETQVASVDGLHDVYTLVAEDPMLDTPGLAPLRQSLQMEALRIYAGLAELFAENPAAQAELAVAQAEIGTLRANLGMADDETETQFQAALDTADKLPTEVQDTDRLLAARSNALVGLAKLAREAGQVEQALEYTQQATDIRQRWVSLYPQDVEAVRKLANAHMNQGMLRALQGDLDQSLSLQQQAQEERRALEVEFEQHPRLLRDMAQAEFNLAFAALRQGDVDTVLQRLEQSHSWFEELVRITPADARMWERFAQVRLKLADFVGESNVNEDRVRSEQLVVEALRDVQALLETHPHQPEYASQLLLHYQSGLEVLISQNNLATAEDAFHDFERALGIVADESDAEAHADALQLLRLHQAKHRALLALGLDATVNPQAALETITQTLQTFGEHAERVQAEPLLADVQRFFMAMQAELQALANRAESTTGSPQSEP